MEGNQKSIFSRRADQRGGCSLSIFDRVGERRNDRTDRNRYLTDTGHFNIREIATGVKSRGSVEFEFDMDDMWVMNPQEPRPFQLRDDTDSFDIRDANVPQDKNTDVPTPDFHRCARLAIASPLDKDEMEFVTKNGGVRKRILKEGTCHSDQVTDGSRVWIHYNLYLEHGTMKTLFLRDSTTDHGMAVSLEIGHDGLLGLQFGLKTMSKGEVAEFAIDPEHGYGAFGVPGFIDKHQHLRMVVELMDVKQTHRKPMTFMTVEEKEMIEISLEDILKEVDQLINAGNAKVEKKLYQDACDRYNWAISLLNDHPIKAVEEKMTTNSEDTQLIIDHKFVQLYANLAFSLLRLENYEDAENVCRTALKLSNQRLDIKPKLHYRLANALFKQSKFEEAKRACEVGLSSKSWGHAELRVLKYHVENSMEIRRARERMTRSDQYKGKAGFAAQRQICDL